MKPSKIETENTLRDKFILEVKLIHGSQLHRENVHIHILADNTLELRLTPELMGKFSPQGLLGPLPRDFFQLSISHRISRLDFKYFQHSLPSLEPLVNLTHLDLSHNWLKAIPIEIFSMQKLHYLNLERNHISFLPENLGRLKDLRELRLSSNSIGSLPSTISNLRRLHLLHMNFNHLEELSPALLELSGLSDLQLNNNRIEEIPSAIGNLYNLQELALAGNDFLFLPSEICNLQNLKRLVIVRSQFHFPEEIKFWLDMIMLNGGFVI